MRIEANLPGFFFVNGQEHSGIFLYNSPLLFNKKEHGERMKKMGCIVPEIFAVYSFFHATLFPPREVVHEPPVASQICW